MIISLRQYLISRSPEYWDTVSDARIRHVTRMWKHLEKFK